MFLVPPCCVHCDRRPDQTVSGAPSPRFVLFVFSSFYLFPVFFLSRQASPLAASPHARQSWEISATGCGYPKPAGWFSSSRVAAPPGPPFAGDHATGPPLTQCPPLTQARRIAADSCLPAAVNPSPVDPVHTSRPGEPCLSCCAHRNILIKSCRSCPWRLVWGRRLLILWPRRPFQPPASLSLIWKRLLGDPVRAPDSSSCPEEASAFKPSQEGFWFLWDVLSCLSGPGGFSCHVMYCPVCLAPEGS